MKWMNAVVCAALLAMAGPAFSEGAPAESPRDYAYGLSLIPLHLRRGIGSCCRWRFISRAHRPICATCACLISRASLYRSAGYYDASAAGTDHHGAAPFALNASPGGKRTAAIKLCYGPETVWKLCWKGNTLRLPDSTIC